MNTLTFTISKEDFPFLIAALSQRHDTLQGSLIMQARDAERRQEQIVVPQQAPKAAPVKKAAKAPLAQRRALLQKLAKTNISVAELARQAGVSYVTAQKARNANKRK